MTEAQEFRALKQSMCRLHARPVGYHPVWLRRDTQDVQVYRDVVERNEYRLPESFGPGDVIVDVGAHVGCFALACLTRGAGLVHCYESDPENFRLLCKNLTPFRDRACLFPDAVLGAGAAGTVGMVRFRVVYTARGFIPPALSGIPDDLRRSDGRILEETGVPCVGIDRVTERAGGRVRLLKLDCEGSEYPILASADLSGVDEVVGELHPGMTWPGIDCEDETVANRLARQGFSVEVLPQKFINRWLFAKRRHVT